MTSMRRSRYSYLPLLGKPDDEGTSPEHFFEGQPPEKQSPHLIIWLTSMISLISILVAVLLHFNSTSELSLVDVSNPHFVASLRKVTPYPNLDHLADAGKLKSAPMVWFPPYIVRANAADPDRMYTTSNTVTLSPSDSMFYRFRMKNPANSTCYVFAPVPTPAKLQSSNKSYVSEGDVSAIEIWNISYWALPAALSWNTRPPRQSLMGTVNFAPPPEIYNPEDERDGMELRPPTPLFDCGGDSRIAFEVTCSDCKLSFEQIMSDPALAFDVAVLG
ncbi:hypothetical protein BV22DRAFT_1133247 [Leucogyrophana mollusca]|uniref:Uncharacterized protein n=1 Tax=Leucogyrophana mollusca TaxID=85980 RepID=A0ACB8B3B8_9AGAM|nr:hypothetical protein BV22DRAFT_1133247 [Leucogyrophana mollusca]